MIYVAKLIKKETEDGLMSTCDDIPLGKEYHVIPSTISMVTGFNFRENRVWKRKMIKTVNDGFLPLELLEPEEFWEKI